MGDNVTTPDGVVRTPEEAASLGVQTVDPSVLAADARTERRRAMFDTTGNKIGTVAEGIVDALSLGLIRETGEEGDIRRDVNAGSALVGNVLGFAAGMGMGGPIRAMTHGAEAAGKAAAKTILRSGEGQLLSRVAAEATASMAMAGTQATGHALMDSVLEDKEFSSEAILDEVKLAGILGAAGGVALHGIGKLASRADIKAQGGILGDVDEALKPHVEATRAYDQVLERHAAEVGALKELKAQGAVDAEFLAGRTEALSRATKAREALDKIDMRKAMDGGDDVLYRKWQQAGVEYRAAIRDLDTAMHAPRVEPELRAEDGLPALEAEPLVGARTRAVLRETDGVPADMSPDLPSLNIDPADVAKRSGNWRNAGRFTAERLVEGKRGLPAKKGQYGDATMVEEATPAGMSDARMARMKERLAATADARAEARAIAQGEPISLTPPPEPTLPSPVVEAPVMTEPPARAGRVTREIPVDPSEYGRVQSRMPMSAKNLPDIYQPEPAAGLTPPEVTGAERPSAMRLAEGAPPEAPGLDPLAPTPREPSLVTPSKPRPFDAAEARVQQAMSDLVERTKGRLDSASALGVLEGSGIRPAGDNVGAYLDQVYALRKAGVFAADAARGVKTPLHSTMDKAVSAAIGHMFAGPVGAVAGMYLRRSGSIAAATGRLMGMAGKAAEKLLTSRRVKVLAASAANMPHAYSERGPIADPIERIQEIKWLAANPDHVMAKVAMSAQDLADQPALLKALQMRAVNQIQRLSVRAPAIFFDKLGRPLSPPAGKLREFYEYENAVHDLPGLLDQLGKGGLTGPQAAALQESWPSVHIKVAAAFLQDPDMLRKLPRETLRSIETITGMPLTNAKDPFWLARQAQAWQPDVPPTPPGKPQAFNINPVGAPTPAQANATGRAPGN